MHKKIGIILISFCGVILPMDVSNGGIASASFAGGEPYQESSSQEHLYGGRTTRSGKQKRNRIQKLDQGPTAISVSQTFGTVGRRFGRPHLLDVADDALVDCAPYAELDDVPLPFTYRPPSHIFSRRVSNEVKVAEPTQSKDHEKESDTVLQEQSTTFEEQSVQKKYVSGRTGSAIGLLLFSGACYAVHKKIAQRGLYKKGIGLKSMLFFFKKNEKKKISYRSKQR